MFDDDVSRRDFILKMSSWFFFHLFSILNRFKRNIDRIWLGFWEAMKKEVDALRKLRHPRLVRFIGACVQPPLLLVVTDGGLPRRAAGSGEKLDSMSFLLPKDLRLSKKGLENSCITLWHIVLDFARQDVGIWKWTYKIHKNIVSVTVFVGIFHRNSPCGTPQRPNKNAFAFRLRLLSHTLRPKKTEIFCTFPSNTSADGWENRWFWWLWWLLICVHSWEGKTSHLGCNKSPWVQPARSSFLYPN